MRILVGCEFSGRVRDAFIKKGHNAISCDLLPSERPGPHIQGDILTVLHDGWDALIVFPTCTFLCRSGLHWNANPEHVRYGGKQSEEALVFVQALLNAPIPKIALENPIGLIGTRIRPADQIIQPYEFGEDASKRTCLWLKNLPLLQPTMYVAPRVVEWPPGSGRMVNRWGNQTDSGNNKVPSTKRQAKIRSETFWGVANAMAEQWG